MVDQPRADLRGDRRATARVAAGRLDRGAGPAQAAARRTAAKAGLPVPEALRNAERPEDVTARKLPGHWEGDFIKGAFNRSALGTRVEPKTRFVILCKMDGCDAASALEGFTRQLQKLPAFLRESLTDDRGSEMARHEDLARRLNIDVWFADPYAPWQRGRNENTNGLIRRYLPKGMDPSTVSQYKLNQIAGLLNGRPRKILGWRTPNEALAEEISKFAKVLHLTLEANRQEPAGRPPSSSAFCALGHDSGAPMESPDEKADKARPREPLEKSANRVRSQRSYSFEKALHLGQSR